MSSFKNVLAVGLTGIVLVAGSGRATFAAQPSGNEVAAAGDDSSLKSTIAASLKKDAMIAPRDIDVNVDDAVVTLTGKVRTVEEKARAASLANVSGVARVKNELEVDPKIDQSKIDAAANKTKTGATKAVDATAKATHKTTEAVEKGVGKAEQGVAKAADKTAEAVGKAGDKTADASITTRVKANFTDEKLLKDSAIDVDTTDHVVTLRGTVDSAVAKERAEAIARGTDGVTRVVNQLIVRAA